MVSETPLVSKEIFRAASAIFQAPIVALTYLTAPALSPTALIPCQCWLRHADTALVVPETMLIFKELL
jgi:hypothetical protein